MLEEKTLSNDVSHQINIWLSRWTLVPITKCDFCSSVFDAFLRLNASLFKKKKKEKFLELKAKSHFSVT